ncbi:hypothetical protein PFLUV_G00166460 [Perca fluviatilis]|uniref:Ubiquitin-like domain-containing protein n=1 Tax=Perca fluviatilis TaxID=8168 RepID=A0A6A5DY25_PERFL|nr:hypothetical protein PFLUV_G00166460 [Perca fluviatilis]
MVVQLKVVSPRGEEKVIDLCENEEQMKGITVLHLEKKITEELKLDGDIRLVFQSKPLAESDLLISYGIRHMSTINTLLMLPGGGC